MTSEASEDQIQEFMADPELTQLAEHLKVTSDLLDIVELSEVQHSDMLAWCMNPAEGHGQGDAVLKDFLIAACVSSRDQSCQSRTHAFFSKWTLSKIRVTSFGSAWVSRELSNVTSDGKKGRLDLCIVDPQNRIIVVIEHKRGAKLNQAQLDKYWQAVDEQIASKPAFEDYLFAYVVLDKKYEDPKEEDLIVEDKNTKMGQQWALCDYSWLTSAAQRAAHQVARDNSSAQLLMAYCQKQTEWENPAERKITYLAASLASKHERVVDRLREIKRLKLAAWTPKMISNTGGDLLYFYLQQQRLCRVLIKTSGIPTVRAFIDQQVTHPDDLIRKGRAWLHLAPESVDELMSSKDKPWPFFVNIKRESGVEGPTTFLVLFVWAKERFAKPDDAQRAREIFAHHFKELAKGDPEKIRRVIIDRGLDAEAAAKKAVATLKSVQALTHRAVKELVGNE